MNRSLRLIAAFTAALLILIFVVFVVAQTAQVVDLAARLHPVAGTVVLWALVAAFVALVAVPVVLFWRLPPPLTPPRPGEGQGAEEYQRALRIRLKRNPATRGLPLASEGELKQALAVLGAQADDLTRTSAGVVFMSTAISQSGRLDAFVVLAELTRLIWRVAHLYSQRPSVRDLLRLYGNVAGTAFVASGLDDIDVSEQMAPLVASVTGGLSGAIPGLQVAASVAVNSVLSGAANAFLVLRVGVITRRYCGSLVAQDRREVRRAAAAEAARQLGGIVKDGAAKITRTTFEVTKGKVSGAAAGVASGAADLGSKVTDAAAGVASGAAGLGSGVISKLGWKKSEKPEGEPGSPPADPEPEPSQ